MSEEGRIVVLLYRALFRVARVAQVELERGKSFLAKEELEAIRNAAGLQKGLLEREGTKLTDVVRTSFRDYGRVAEKRVADGSSEVDAAFRTLRYLNNRLPVYQKLVYRNSSNAVTQGVRVRVKSHFLGRDSFGYRFAYNVKVANEGSDPVTLVNREWIIVDSDGREGVTRGPGVVGKQPVIQPGSTYEYNSGTPLRTRIGSMWGKYEMVKQNKGVFEARIAPFALVVPSEYGHASEEKFEPRPKLMREGDDDNK
ncbi:hypothetical protein NDN08_003428 [Rhodosorus marinus]|uniref:ApaG domain-containing protein n=1 Tax=Rhodosorus marinus TaxID=101924 RepID=A0AAV8UWG5_9RHOD|nr:hypothetical protein NDN08_003428 [Rhodosorus marinus]